MIDSGAGWLPAALVLAAAVLVAWRKRRRPSTGPRTRRGAALLVVVALVGGSSLLGTPAYAQPFDCKESPEPDRPGTGLVGSLDPPRASHGEIGSVYREVGYGGLIWYTYDLGCAGQAVFNPATTTDTWMGNEALNLAKFGVGGVNWAHYVIAGGGEVLDPLDNLISTGTKAMYTAVFTTWIGPVLAVLAVVLLVLAVRGDLARQTQRAAVAVIALVVGSAAYLAPIDWAKAADPLLLDGVTKMQEGFLDPIGLGNRNTLPTVLVDQVIYQNWLRGEFGSPEVPQAQQFGRDLLRSQTFTIDEVNAQQDTLDNAQKKKSDYAAIAGKLGDRYPYFQGKSGSRMGAGALALVEAACIALFQLLSKVLVLVAMLMLRLLVMTAPAVAVVAVLKPDILPSLLRVAGAAIVNTLVVGALAGLHALLVVSLFRPGSGIDLWLALLVTGVVTVVLWAVARPFRRLVSMVSLTREQFGGIVPGAGTGPMSRVWTRMRGGEAEDKQARWWEERAGAMAGQGGGGGGVRPETESVARVRATATRVTRPRTEIESPTGAVAVPGARRPAALPSGSARATWAEPAEVDDRTIYRRPDAVARRPGAREVTPEIVDGVPVYRIYRPLRSAPRGAG